MLFDDLNEQLKSIYPDVQTIISFWNASSLESTFQSLQQKSEQENFWQQPDNTAVLKELQRVRQLRDHYLATTKDYQSLSELVTMFKDDEEELKKLTRDIAV